jgi:hypothetical protein
MDLREIGFGDVDWINLAQDRDRWQALVNTVRKGGTFFTSILYSLASQGLSSMELV